MSKLYTERDIIEQRDYYSRHTSAMTGEGLDRKSDIAAELAHRDIQIDQLQSRVAELCGLIKYAQENSGVCMCGDDIKDHNQSSGHPPVDVWDHAVEQVDQGETSEALILRKQAEAVQASRRAISSCSEIPNSSGHASRQAVSVPEWIKCSDRLPDVLDVWIKMTDGSVVACWSKLDGDFYWNGGGSESYILENTVTHWKPRQQEKDQ